jgi:dCTP diphosphatase
VREVGELAAEVQWTPDDQVLDWLREDGEARRRVETELADVVIYLTRLADVLDIDLVNAADAKIDINEARFPAQARATGTDASAGD